MENTPPVLQRDKKAQCLSGYVKTITGSSFGRHVNELYPHFLIRSRIDYPIQNDYEDVLIHPTVLVDNPKAFKSFCLPNFKIIVGKDESIIFEDYNEATNVKFGIGSFHCEVDFEFSNTLPFRKLLKFIGTIRENSNIIFEIVKPDVANPVLMDFIIREKFYTTYAAFGRIF